MAAHNITQRTSVSDPKVIEIYFSKVNATIENFSGRKIVRAGVIEVIEEDMDPDRMTMTEFPDMYSLKAWNNSPEYEDLNAMRYSVMTSNAIPVKGI